MSPGAVFGKNLRERVGIARRGVGVGGARGGRVPSFLGCVVGRAPVLQPGEESPDCAHLFGALHDLVARFQSARLKVKADEERKAKLRLLEEKRKTPEAKRERRRERRARPRGRGRRLRAVDAGKSVCVWFCLCLPPLRQVPALHTRARGANVAGPC